MANEQRPQQQSKPPEHRPTNQLPITPVAAQPANWVTQASAYLTEHGWEKVSENEQGLSVWRDPNGSRARAQPTTIIKIPSVGGGEEIIKQWTGPPIPWEYTLVDAVWVQRERDKHGPGIGTPIERLDRLTVQHDRLVQAHAVLVKAAERFAQVPTTLKPDEVAALKRQLQEALSQARQTLAA